MTASADGRTASVVKGGAGYKAEQGPDYHPGVSAETVGATDLWFGTVVLQPGQRTKAHVHERHESAFYMLSGEELELWSGDALETRALAHPGDYLFIPRNVLHVGVNRSGVPVVLVGSRSEPTAQESLIMRPEMDSRVP
jgi:uncharacterized RmlC-like cupin family protein